MVEKLPLEGRFLKKRKRAECIVELCNHAGFFKNAREVLEKHEPQGYASRTSRVFLKNSKCLYNSTMYEEQVFISFIKCIMNFARSY